MIDPRAFESASKHPVGGDRHSARRLPRLLWIDHRENRQHRSAGSRGDPFHARFYSHPDHRPIAHGALHRVVSIRPRCPEQRDTSPGSSLHSGRGDALHRPAHAGFHQPRGLGILVQVFAGVRSLRRRFGCLLDSDSKDINRRAIARFSEPPRRNRSSRSFTTLIRTSLIFPMDRPTPRFGWRSTVTPWRRSTWRTDFPFPGGFPYRLGLIGLASSPKRRSAYAVPTSQIPVKA